MTNADLLNALALIGLIGGSILSFLFFIKKTIDTSIKNAMKATTTSLDSIEQKVDDIEEKVMSRKSIQQIIGMMTRELVGLKRKVMPTINLMKVYFSKKGLKIKNKTGEYLGDISSIIDSTEEEFVDSIEKILKDE